MISISQFQGPEIKDINEMEIRGSSRIANRIQNIVVNKNSGRSYYVIMELDTPTITPESKCKIKCSCQDFTYRWAAVLHQQGALLEADQMGMYKDVLPKVTNPNMKIGACKHIKYVIFEGLKGNIRPLSTEKGEI